MRSEIELSKATTSLWGKLTNKDGKREWLPLWIHLVDTAEIMEFLWKQWIPEGTKQIIVRGIDEKQNFSENREEIARRVAVFLAATHDMGKASPCFQYKAKDIGFGDILLQIEGHGLLTSDISKNDSFPHALLSQEIVEKRGLDRSYAVVLGGHHGIPPEKDKLGHAKRYSNTTGIESKEWEDIHDELILCALQHSGLQCIPNGKLSMEAQVVLSGLLIMADWIASGDGFSLFSADFLHKMPVPEYERALGAWDELNLPPHWEISDEWKNKDLYSERFHINTPRPVQESVAEIVAVAENPGIIIVEAPMGEGKTEAALVAAEILADKHKKSGIYFALPTQATSDGVFGRINNWVEKQVEVGKESKSIFLAHGKAGINEDYQGIKMRSNIYDYENPLEQEDVIVHDWTKGKKKGLLSDFAVGTIDQILMCGLKQKHLALRHLGIANKVVIIDECHAYDAYMSSYLTQVLAWLGAYKVPVIILSATLPCSKRKQLVEAYIPNCETKNGSEWMESEAYPLITLNDGNGIKQKTPKKSKRKQHIRINQLDESKLENTLNDLLVDGGCVGIIRNTVANAQETAKKLREYFGKEVEVRLLHARFISEHRVNQEKEVRNMLGPPKEVSEEKRPNKLIVIGTQVMEQSLDVDFDMLFTDICPMDLLLQRIGRLHRHDRKRPRPKNFENAICFVMGINSCTDFENGSERVYGKYFLMKTYALLPNSLDLPEDISKLVQKAYENKYEELVLQELVNKSADRRDCMKKYEEAKVEYARIIDEKMKKALTYQINKPNSKKNLVDWLNAGLQGDASGKRGEATVRDIDGSLEVLVIRRKRDGKLYTLPGLKTYADYEIERNGDISDAVAKVIACCSLSLPGVLTKFYVIDKVISELEKMIGENGIKNWYASHWLAGELFLILDEDFRISLCGYTLEYSENYGLQIKKEEG